MYQSVLLRGVSLRPAADVNDLGTGCIEGTVKSELQLAVFSGIKLGWEPLLEPWHARLQCAAPTGTPPAQHQRLVLSSGQGLELTVTQTALEAVALAGGALAAAAAVGDDPALLDAQLAAAGGAAAYSAAYWLHNQTGSTLEVWLAPPGAENAAGAGIAGASSPGASSGASSSYGSPGESAASSGSGGSQGPWVPAGRPEMVVRAGGRVALPVVAASSTQRQGLHVGAPSATQGVVPPPHLPPAHADTDAPPGLERSASRLALAASTPRLPRLGSSLEGGSSSLAAAAAALHIRPLLYFRLAEQTDLCGPLHLDR